MVAGRRHNKKEADMRRLLAFPAILFALALCFGPAAAPAAGKQHVQVA